MLLLSSRDFSDQFYQNAQKKREASALWRAILEAKFDGQSGGRVQECMLNALLSTIN
jgi:hypothetical protein